MILIKRFFVVLLISFNFCCVRGALNSEEILVITDSCCSHGEKIALDGGSCSISSIPEDVEEAGRETCVDIATPCCQDLQQKKKDCANGMNYVEPKRCSVPQTEMAKVCCEECSFGKWAGESQGKDACGSPVSEGVTPTTGIRKNAYHQCCLKAANKPTTTTSRPTTTPKPTTTTPKRTTPAPKESCSSNPCEHLCNDDGGKVTCECLKGFRLQGDKRSCKDINECAEAVDDICNKDNTVCHNTPGSFKCVPLRKRDVGLKCPPGFKRNVQQQVCDDINECQLPRPPCPKYLCENSIGGFKCAGKSGKPAVEEPEDEPDPEQPVKADVDKDDMCPLGFRTGQDDECEDIDECIDRLDDCQRLSQYCINTHGSFFCQDHVSKRCAPGFKVNTATGICEDIDECETSPEDVCRRNQVCVNLPGAYNCKSKTSTLPKLTSKTCQEGTRLRPGSSSCEDIDECREGTHLCDQFQNCINTYGGHECRCKNGFELDSATGSCVDVDECALKLDNCGTTQYCLNVLGTFTCTKRPPTTTTSTTPMYDYEYYDVEEEETPENNSTSTSTTTAKPTTTSTAKPRPKPRPRPYSPPAPVRTTPKPSMTAPKITTTQKPTPKPTPRTTAKPTQRTTVSTSTSTTTTTSPKPTQTPTTVRIPPRPRPYTTQRPRHTVRPRPVTPKPRPVTPKPRPVTPTTASTPYTNPTRPYKPFPTLDTNEIDPRRTSPTPNMNSWLPEKPKEKVTEKPHERVNEKPNDRSPEKPDGTVSVNAGDLPKYKWTNLVGKDNFEIGSLHCLGGYEKNENGECVDIDECDSGRHICNSLEVCSNRAGGYVCECSPGYSRDPTGWCVPLPSPTPTTTESNTVESAPERPYNPMRPSRPSYSNTPIKCAMGFRYEPSIGRCIDIDECKTGRDSCKPDEHCVNIEGGYKCVCGQRCSPEVFKPNYVSASPPSLPRSESVVTVGSQYGSPGPQVMNAHRSGASYSCPWGYKLTRDHRCVDIDECVLEVSECGPTQSCENFPGGYSCQCPSGHKQAGRGQCEDIDECRIGNPCQSNAVCINTPGSYHCDCGEGFQNAPSNNKVCIDIDECMEESSRCRHRCVNVWGSYRCTCDRGYRLGSDNRTCEDIDECQEMTSTSHRLCLGVCVNTEGSFTCNCPPGYTLAEDKRSCIDIDECESGEASCAHGEDGSVCVNTRGSYHCHTINCPAGYQLDASHRCNRIQRMCYYNDMSCIRQPSTYSYNFITFASNIYLPKGRVDLFTMRGPSWNDAIFDFKMKMIDVHTSAPRVRPVDVNCFDIRPVSNICVVSLVCSIEGPQVAEMELEMSLYRQQNFAGTAVARLVIIVSEYEY